MNRRINSKANHLEQIEPVMDEVAAMELGHTPVHIIDCEADSLGHFRKWIPKGHLILIRCDDRRVKWDGDSVLLCQIKDKFDSELLFQDACDTAYHGKKIKRHVAKVVFVLDGIHNTRVDGIRKDRTELPLALSAVFPSALSRRLHSCRMDVAYKRSRRACGLREHRSMVLPSIEV
jgi:hypothetical protein